MPQTVYSFTRALSVLLGGGTWAMQRSHGDPFDRMIAATAIALECPLVSKDVAFDSLDDFSK